MAESVDSAVHPGSANAAGTSTVAQDESDFSQHKIKIAAAIVLGPYRYDSQLKRLEAI